MRKGQYLALESILSVSLGIAIAVGSITMFSNYREEVLATGESKQVDIVESELVSAIHTLQETDNGYITLDLPENVGGRSYEVSFNDGMKITTRQNTYSSSFHGLKHRYSFSGSAEGSTVKVFKNGSQYMLRDE